MLKGVAVAAVAVTNTVVRGQSRQTTSCWAPLPATRQKRCAWLFLLLLVSWVPGPAHAKVLPEDRADVLWHLYDGGGVTIQGPSVRVRKAYKDKVSVWGNYYVDMISGASIDVEATASKYTEERTEYSVGLDYLHDKTNLGIGATRSSESDYEAETVRVSLSQDFFADMTSVSIGYAYGDDIVSRNGDTWSDTATHQSFRLELSQIVTRRMLMNFGFESVVDAGYLNNPYRSARFLDASGDSGYLYQQEIYPRTRASDAAAVRGMIYLPYRASLRAEYRYYTDTWDIIAHTAEIAYTHPFGDRLELDARIRFYTQTQAGFYSDLYPYRDAQNFLARDKEMSAFNSNSVGFGVAYAFLHNGQGFLSKGSANLFVDFITFDYDNFNDVTRECGLDGEVPYQFDAIVLRAFLSFWF